MPAPAFASGKPLSPKAVVVDLRHLMSLGEGNVHETIRDETLWACTIDQACVQECPVLIGHVDLISATNGSEPITLHDPCYLARVNGEVDATRAVVRRRTTSNIARCLVAEKDFLLRGKRRADVV